MGTRRMKLSEWAKEQGVTYLTAFRYVQANRMPKEVKIERMPSGTLFVIVDDEDKSLKLQNDTGWAGMSSDINDSKQGRCRSHNILDCDCIESDINLEQVKCKNHKILKCDYRGDDTPYKCRCRAIPCRCAFDGNGKFVGYNDKSKFVPDEKVTDCRCGNASNAEILKELRDMKDILIKVIQRTVSDTNTNVYNLPNKLAKLFADPDMQKSLDTRIAEQLLQKNLLNPASDYLKGIKALQNKKTEMLDAKVIDKNRFKRAETNVDYLDYINDEVAFLMREIKESEADEKYDRLDSFLRSLKVSVKESDAKSNLIKKIEKGKNICIQMKKVVKDREKREAENKLKLEKLVNKKMPIDTSNIEVIQDTLIKILMDIDEQHKEKVKIDIDAYNKEKYDREQNTNKLGMK